MVTDLPGSSFSVDGIALTPKDLGIGAPPVFGTVEEERQHGLARGAFSFLVKPATTEAPRFTSEEFDVPAGDYTCAYWVRGKGSFRHRTYSTAGWSPLRGIATIGTPAGSATAMAAAVRFDE